MRVEEEFVRWLSSDTIDVETKNELRAMSADEVRDAFYRDLEFGTGGLRGVIGAGTNRMNVYTVGKATQGLANYIKKQGGGSVAIAYDSRRFSPEFALSAALCLCANGIGVELFESLRPTPELSFAVRRLGCIAGIVITASHNPKQYNGYKVYWADGAQITPPRDREIIDEVNAVSDYESVLRMEQSEAEEKGLLHRIGKEVDDAYLAAIRALVLEPEAIAAERDLKIVYTPLHGTGNLPVRRILRELGFRKVSVVSEQEQPDGRFPTVAYPNPEDANAFALALAQAKRTGAELVLATDPDADRLGVYVRDAKGEYHALTGNMSGLLIAEYRLSRLAAKGLLPERRADGALVTTIVSSNMAKPLCAAYGITLIETLTGFKYIGEQIYRFEQAKAALGGCSAEHGAYEYLFGFEESYGCLVGTYARDKDAVSAVLSLCEAAAYYKQQGLTLWEQMLRLYEVYGFYRERLASVTLQGEDGAARIAAMMDALRADPPKTLGGAAVLAVRDYRSGVRKELPGGAASPTDLPSSNVLYYELAGDGWCCVRPSGTEPKIKFYFGAKASSVDAAEANLDALEADLTALVG